MSIDGGKFARGHLNNDNLTRQFGDCGTRPGSSRGVARGGGGGSWDDRDSSSF